tara:strand:+ start:1817 stop:1996 length:180 start_codon:yes stop_codon:yes gene_type:complete
MATCTRSAAKTVSNFSDINSDLLKKLHEMLALVDNPATDRVVVELRVKQVIDEEAPKDS